MKNIHKLYILALFLLLAAVFGGGVKYGQHLYSPKNNSNGGILNSISSGTALQEEIYIDIKGAVEAPGVYQFPQGSRVCHALEEAKPLKEAYLTAINQAEFLKDGQELIIYYAPKEEDAAGEYIAESRDLSSPKPAAGNSAANISGKININTASSGELESLPGIGPSKAGAIINYRRDNGKFTKIEDIKKVSGIGDVTYGKIKGMISVD